MFLEEVVSGQSFELKPQVVHAGAGTGKTTKLIDEVFKVYKIFKEKEKRDPNLMVCTFTIKATQELRERLYKKAIKLKDWSFLSYIQSSSLHISTIDSILSSFLRNYSHLYDLTPDFNLEDFQRENKLFNQLSEKYFFEKYPHLLEKMIFSNLQEALRFYIEAKLKYGEIDLFNESDFKEFNLEKENYESQEMPLKYKEEIKKIIGEGLESLDKNHFVPFFKEFKLMADKFFTEYLIQKKIQGCLVVGDLTLFSLDLLKKHPHVAQFFSKEWDYWFIDEYQDTNWVQEQIIESITGFKNVFCVGDPKQSIYFFRGADPNVFQRRVISLGKEVNSLNVNYRSNPSLIHFFNDFFPKEEGFITFKSPEVKIKNTKEPCVSFLTYDKEPEEAFESVYHYIQKLLGEGNKYNDIAILSRKNDDLLSLASFLKKKKINILLDGSKSFSKNRLVLDALFLFKFLMNPHDDINLIALFRTPYFYLKDQKVADLCYGHNQFCEGEKKISFWTYLEKNNLEENDVIWQLKKYLDTEKVKGLLKVFEQALLERFFLDLSHYQDSSGSSESNLWKLLSLLHDTSNPLDLFYSLMEEEGVNSASEKEAASFLKSDAIQLMTIHKSKGLEFKHVIICDLSIGLPQRAVDEFCVFDPQKGRMSFAVPIGNRKKRKIKNYGHKKIENEIKRQELDERDRLFYVAMTRAKESLALLLPSMEIKKPSWLNKTSFFRPYADITYKDGNPDKSIQTWSLKEKIYQKNNYSFMVKKHFKFSSGKQPMETSVDVIPSYKNKDIKMNPIKSPKDFCLDMGEGVPAHLSMEGQNNKTQKIIIPHIKNKIFNMSLGNYLHYYLQMLSKHSLESIISQLDYVYLSEKEKIKIQEGLEYIVNLKNPDFNYFFKNGKTEWSFKFKKENVTLQGRIDLWGKKRDKDLWVFDYKSGSSQNVKKQLIFYSWVLDNMYQFETVKMCEVYPFEKRIEIQDYKENHQKEMENWLKKLI